MLLNYAQVGSCGELTQPKREKLQKDQKEVHKIRIYSKDAGDMFVSELCRKEEQQAESITCCVMVERVYG